MTAPTSTMILRNAITRQSQRSLASPLFQSRFRCLSLDSTSTSEPDRTVESSLESHALHLNRNVVPSRPRVRKPVPMTVKEKWDTKQHVKKRTRNLGSRFVGKPYYADQLLQNPPGPEDVTLELLMASQAHMGHHTSLWNPMNQRYIYGVREGIHIISLEATAAYLRRAAKVVEGVAYHGGLILFVGTRPGQDEAVVKAALTAGGCHLFQKWIPGTITNGDQILGAGAGLKAVDEHDQKIEGFEDKLAEWAALKPDLVVCMNPIDNYLMLHECAQYNIPTIGVIDTNSNPTWVTYPIPANDDSLRCIQVIAGVLGKAGGAGQKKRLEAAKPTDVSQVPVITWLPPPRLGAPVTEESLRKAADEEKIKKAKRDGTYVKPPEEEEEENERTDASKQRGWGGSITEDDY